MKRIVSTFGKLNWKKRAYAVFLMCATTAIALPAQTFTVLDSIWLSPSGLVQATDGNLYGTTIFGGGANGGTVFKITPSGTLTTLYSFCSQTGCPDGFGPWALVQGTDGNLYGTTDLGGANDDGTIFKITPSGTLTTLYSFCLQSGCTDGGRPQAGLVRATNGCLFGTTAKGGANDRGTVFRISASGTLTTLYSFCSIHTSQSYCADGDTPKAALVEAPNGNLYGTTVGGGASGYGTVFKITPSGVLTTLYSLCSQSGCTDGKAPYAGLVRATDGNFYGTTFYGVGANGGGTVFRITPTGTLTTLYSFGGDEHPLAGLVQATDGNLYGTTLAGGANDEGTIFKITPSGTLTTLYSFCSQSFCTDGSFPYTALVQDTNGSLYGTTSQGADGGSSGTIFRLSVGLGPFVETQPASGTVGRHIKILGTNLTGATSVNFSGTAAVFKVVSSSLIAATVPAGASTGTVQVVTSGGTLSSNVPFRVHP